MSIDIEKVKGLQVVAGAGVVWINIQKPTPKDLEYLKQLYPFHPLDLEDCISKRQLSKIDEYEDYLFIVLHFPYFHKKLRYTLPSQVAIFIGRNYLVTIHEGELKPITEIFEKCQHEEGQRGKYLGQDPGFLLYNLIDNLVEYCFPMMEKMKSNLEDVEDMVFSDRIDASKQVAELRRDVAHQRRIISPLRRVVADLEVKVQRFSRNNLSIYFSDVNDHIQRLWENLEEFKETIEIYKDVDFTLNTERTNRILTVLAILMVVMLPFSIISGIYGMNIPLPFGLEGGSLFSFTVLIFTMLLLTTGLLIFFRRQHWI